MLGERSEAIKPLTIATDGENVFPSPPLTSRNDGRMWAMAHPRAGQPALPEDLIDVDAVISAYYDLVPTPATPTSKWFSAPLDIEGQAWIRRSTMRTSPRRPRRSSSIALPKASPVRSIIGKDTHALSTPAWTTAIEVLVANGVAVRAADDEDYTPTPAVSRAIVVHNATASARQYGRWDCGNPVAQPAPRRGLQVQPAAWRPGGQRCDERDRRSCQCFARRRLGNPQAAVRGRGFGGSAVRLPGRLLRRPCQRA